MRYYFLYYLFTFFAAYAARNPYILVVVVVFLAARRWLPDPVVFIRTFGRLGALKRQAEMNPANIIARRDLGRAYLDLRRPAKALHYLDEARARDPRDAEIAYLRGVALLQRKEPEQALRAFGESVGVDEHGEAVSSRPGNRVAIARHADAYLGAAKALIGLGRLPQAEEALLASASCNSSIVEPRVRLATVRSRLKDDAGTKAALLDATSTWRQLPAHLKRKQLPWRLRATLVGFGF